MTTTNHFLTGALIALVIRQPLYALPIAFMSHFVLDSMPHYGEGKMASEYVRTALSWTVTKVDIFVAIGIMILLIVTQQYLLVVAALVAFSPDFAWVYRHIRRKFTGRSAKRSRFSKFHAALQTEYKWGLLVEVPYMVIVSIICVSLLAI